MEKAKHRTRSTNFTTTEMEVLLKLVESHKEIIESKKTDSVTNGEKDKQWEQIAAMFNATVGTGRTSKHLRSKWDAWKKCTKKEYSDKLSSLQTSDGEPNPDIKLRNWGDRVLQIMGISAAGTYSCDSDNFFGGVETEIGGGMPSFQDVLEQNRNAENIHIVSKAAACDQLMQRKLELVELQMNLLRKEYEERERRNNEKHRLEMDVLRAKLRCKCRKNDE